MFTMNCKGRLLEVDKPLVMGIINITPDSFYAGSRQTDITTILKKAETMLKDGAAIIDVGGQSTRPGSERVDVAEELHRVINPIIAIQKEFPAAFISIDTYYAKVAKEAVESGAVIVNDISNGILDPLLIETVASLQVPYVCMHIQGSPQTMHHDPVYYNVTLEVTDFLIRRVEELRKAGITDLIIDPGFGFGKTIAHNLQLLKKMSALTIIGCPLMVGLSRKSTIYKTLGVTADKALNGTTALHTIALQNGASILRAHDVKEAIEVITLMEAYKNA